MLVEVAEPVGVVEPVSGVELVAVVKLVAVVEVEDGVIEDVTADEPSDVQFSAYVPVESYASVTSVVKNCCPVEFRDKIEPRSPAQYSFWPLYLALSGLFLGNSTNALNETALP